MGNAKLINPDEKELILESGLDYYLENGYMVFTARYLSRRGKCCGSGCRHCPYRTKKRRKTA